MGETVNPVLSIDRIIESLIDSYWVRKFSDTKFSVIASYEKSLKDIAEKYGVELVEVHNSVSKLTVNGVFEIK